MNEPIKITYCFDFDNGTDKTFIVNLDNQYLNYINEFTGDSPDWANLSYKKCTNCPLSETDNQYCPVAKNLVPVTEKFSNISSHENVFVTVTTEERTYKKRTTIDEGLGSLMGVIMVTSGCPILEYLKPMARFHLPFASPLETTIRTMSMFLLAQYLANEDLSINSIDFNFDDIENIYSKINETNVDFSRRLAAACEKNANLGALVNLDCNATLVTMTVEETLREFKRYFSAYM